MDYSEDGPGEPSTRDQWSEENMTPPEPSKFFKLRARKFKPENLKPEGMDPNDSRYKGDIKGDFIADENDSRYDENDPRHNDPFYTDA